IQTVVDRVSHGSRDGGIARALLLARQAVAMGLAPVARIDRAEPRDFAFADSAQGDLVGRAPLRPVTHRGDRESVASIAEAVAQDAVVLVVVVPLRPGSVVIGPFDRVEKVPLTEPRRARREDAGVVERP